jgi:predicted P-loop ATPase
VFCGTTNEESFISDNTGSRRFWPVKIGKVNVEWLIENRDQLWAEAVSAFRAGETWWLDGRHETDLKKVSEDFKETDPWQPMVEEWLIARNELSVPEIMSNALDLDANQMTKFSQMRVSDILRDLGWRRKRISKNNKRVYLWIRPEVLAFPQPIDTDNGSKE